MATNKVHPAPKSTAAWNAMDKNQGKLHQNPSYVLTLPSTYVQDIGCRLLQF